MKKKLKTITNLTINDLLNNEIIMPSTYFEKFNKKAKDLEINLEDDDFKKEINDVILNEFNTIELYMKELLKNISVVEDATSRTKKALVEKDSQTIDLIYNQMRNLEDEIKELTSKIYIDNLTNTYNRKWIYNKFLDKDLKFKGKGICILINISDYSYIQKEYGSLLTDNLLIFISSFIKKKLKEDNTNFEIARFTDEKFLIFLEKQDIKNIHNLIYNAKISLANTTLKSNSGVIIKPTYEYKVAVFDKKEDSKDIFERLIY